MVKSPKFTLKGWSIKEWALHNYENLKEILKVAIPLVVGLSFVKENPSLVFLITAGGKLALDTLEFWYKEKK